MIEEVKIEVTKEGEKKYTYDIMHLDGTPITAEGGYKTAVDAVNAAARELEEINRK